MELTLFNEERRFPKPNSNDDNNNCNSNNNKDDSQHNNDDDNNHLKSDLSQIQHQCNTLEPLEHMHKNTNTGESFFKGYIYTWSALSTFELVLTCLVCRLAKKIVNITILKKRNCSFGMNISKIKVYLKHLRK